jgi:integrase
MHRMNSVRQLRKEDVDLQAGRVHWRGEFDKTGRELVTPLSPEAVEAIRNAPPVLSPWLIAAETDPSRPVSRSVLNDWIMRCSAQCTTKCRLRSLRRRWKRSARHAEGPKRLVDTRR